MNRENSIIISRTAGDETHYLILNKDEKGRNWEFPKPEYGQENYREIVQKLGIAGEEIEDIDKDESPVLLETETDCEPVLSGEFKKHYEGGLFVSRPIARQLLNSDSLGLLE